MQRKLNLYSVNGVIKMVTHLIRLGKDGILKHTAPYEMEVQMLTRQEQASA
jgi:hypothetical protein